MQQQAGYDPLEDIDDDMAAFLGNEAQSSPMDPAPTALPSSTGMPEAASLPPQQSMPPTQALPPGAQGMAPPPPPPPPPAPAAIGEYASSWMENPNRYLSDLVTQTRETGDARRAAFEEDAVRGIEEWAAGRGLTGSSLEGENRIRLQGQLDRNRSEEEMALLEALAGYESMDRLAAGQFGIDAAEFNRSGDQFDRTLGLDERRLEMTGDQFDRTLGLDERRLGQDQSQFDSSLDLDRDRMDQDMLQFAESLGLSREQLDVARDQFDRSLGLDERRLDEASSQFDRTFGLDEQRLALSDNQFSQQIALERDQLAQSDDQFRMALASDESRFAMDLGLRERAMDLQAQGMAEDEAYRRAALEQENDLRTEAMALQERGMTQDDAYRYAALNQDAEFRRSAEDLQRTGMELDEAYRRAELGYREQTSAQQDETTRMAILVQLMNALNGAGGVGDMSKYYDMIMNGGGPPDPDVDTGPSPENPGTGNTGRQYGDPDYDPDDPFDDYLREPDELDE